MYSISKFLSKLSKYEVEEYGEIKEFSLYKSVFIPYNKDYVIKRDINNVYSCDEEIYVYNMSKEYKLNFLFVPIKNIKKIVLPIDYFNYCTIYNEEVSINFLKYVVNTEYYIQNKVEVNEVDDDEVVDIIDELINANKSKYSYIESRRDMWYSSYLILLYISMYEVNGLEDIDSAISRIVENNTNRMINHMDDVRDMLEVDMIRMKNSIEERNSSNSSNSSNNSDMSNNSNNSNNNSSSSIGINPIVNFLVDNGIEDVHSENWGWLNGFPVIFDYSGSSGDKYSSEWDS